MENRKLTYLSKTERQLATDHSLFKERLIIENIWERYEIKQVDLTEFFPLCLSQDAQLNIMAKGFALTAAGN